MLSLTRKVGEKIIIGDRDVTVKVIAVKGNQVILQFDADPKITIHREEVYNRIQADKQNKGSNTNDK